MSLINNKKYLEIKNKIYKGNRGLELKTIRESIWALFVCKEAFLSVLSEEQLTAYQTFLEPYQEELNRITKNALNKNIEIETLLNNTEKIELYKLINSDENSEEE